MKRTEIEKTIDRIMEGRAEVRFNGCLRKISGYKVICDRNDVAVMGHFEDGSRGVLTILNTSMREKTIEDRLKAVCLCDSTERV